MKQRLEPPHDRLRMCVCVCFVWLLRPPARRSKTHETAMHRQLLADARHEDADVQTLAHTHFQRWVVSCLWSVSLHQATERKPPQPPPPQTDHSEASRHRPKQRHPEERDTLKRGRRQASRRRSRSRRPLRTLFSRA